MNDEENLTLHQLMCVFDTPLFSFRTLNRYAEILFKQVGKNCFTQFNISQDEIIRSVKVLFSFLMTVHL